MEVYLWIKQDNRQKEGSLDFEEKAVIVMIILMTIMKMLLALISSALAMCQALTMGFP